MCDSKGEGLSIEGVDERGPLNRGRRWERASEQRAPKGEGLLTEGVDERGLL